MEILRQGFHWAACRAPNTIRVGSAKPTCRGAACLLIAATVSRSKHRHRVRCSAQLSSREEDSRFDQGGEARESVARELKAHRREIAMKLVALNGMELETMSFELRCDREIVMAAVSQNGRALQWAAFELRSDREIVMAAVSQNGRALQGAELRSDREIVMAAVSQNGYALGWAAEELSSDREIVMAAVSQDGYALRWAADGLKADREIVMAAVSQEGDALFWAEEELQADREIVMAAVSQNGRALQWAAEELRGDWEIVMAAASRDGMSLRYATKELQGDLDIATMAVAENPKAVEHVARQLRGDDRIVKIVSGATDEETLELEVLTLSGRCCRCSLHFHERGKKTVLHRCLSSLGSEPLLQMISVGTLMLGAQEIKNPEQLETGRSHEVTLVLTALKLL